MASLERRGQRGPTVALSRHSWRWRAHADVPLEPFGDFVNSSTRGVGELVRRVRRELEAAAAVGLPWQAVFDALRRQGPEICTALPRAERARLLCHLRTLWDVHRFRVAPQIDVVIRRRLGEGSLRILAASLRDARADAGGILVEVRPRDIRVDETLRVDHVGVTTGPALGAVTRSDPVLGSLAEGNLPRADPLRPGLDTSPTGLALKQGGREVAGLLIAGPLARATFGEFMGLPEVTSYAEWIAGEVGRFIAGTDRTDASSAT